MRPSDFDTIVFVDGEEPMLANTAAEHFRDDALAGLSSLYPEHATRYDPAEEFFFPEVYYTRQDYGWLQDQVTDQCNNYSSNDPLFAGYAAHVAKLFHLTIGDPQPVRQLRKAVLEALVQHRQGDEVFKEIMLQLYVQEEAETLGDETKRNPTAVYRTRRGANIYLPTTLESAPAYFQTGPLSGAAPQNHPNVTGRDRRARQNQAKRRNAILGSVSPDNTRIKF